MDSGARRTTGPPLRARRPEPPTRSRHADAAQKPTRVLVGERAYCFLSISSGGGSSDRTTRVRLAGRQSAVPCYQGRSATSIPIHAAGTRDRAERVRWHAHDVTRGSLTGLELPTPVRTSRWQKRRHPPDADTGTIDPLTAVRIPATVGTGQERGGEGLQNSEAKAHGFSRGRRSNPECEALDSGIEPVNRKRDHEDAGRIPQTSTRSSPPSVPTRAYVCSRWLTT